MSTPKKRIIYRSDGTIIHDGIHVVRNWIGRYEYFFDVLFGRPSSYHPKPIWSRSYLQVGHNLIILDKVEKNKENNPENS